MSYDPVPVRSWIDPGWGDLIHRVEPFQHHWQKSESWNHIGVQGLKWAGAFFLLGSVAPILDLTFGNLSLDQFFRNIARIEILSLFLGIGFATALLERWLAHMGWMRASADGAQAEVYTNGVYLAPYGFVGGLHPFFPWNAIRSVDVSVHRNRRHVTLSLYLRELKKPGALRLDADAVAEMLGVPEISDGSTPLADALHRAADSLHP